MTTQETEAPSLRDVELVRAGTWNARTGKVTISREDLADAARAAQDSEIDIARIKLGHQSSLNDHLGDGAPAYGTVTNVRLSADGNSLLGDFVDMDENLIKVIGRNYRQRSVELRRNVKTVSGKMYRSALTAVALLGVSAPAVKGLPDLMPIHASEDDHATDDGTITIEMSENSDTGEITNETAETVEAGTQTPENTRGEPNQKEMPNVALSTEEARELLGMAETATDEEVNQALRARLTATAEEAAPVEDEVEAPAAAETPEAPVEDAPAAEADVEASAPDVKGGIVELSQGSYDELITELSELRANDAQRRAEAEAAHRAEIIEVALSEGKITADEKGDWETWLSEAPETIEAQLAKMKPRVHTKELGSEVALSAPEVDDKAKQIEAARAFLNYKPQN